MDKHQASEGSTSTQCPCCGAAEACAAYLACCALHTEVSFEEKHTSDDEQVAPSRSQISEQVRRLQAATLRAIQRRERLPQRLFWSLFHSEIEEVRQKRQRRRDEQRAQIYPYLSTEEGDF